MNENHLCVEPYRYTTLNINLYYNSVSKLTGLIEFKKKMKVQFWFKNVSDSLLSSCSLKYKCFNKLDF